MLLYRKENKSEKTIYKIERKQAWWWTPVTSVLCKAKAGGLQVLAQAGQLMNSARPCLRKKTNNQKRAEDTAQCDSTGFHPSTGKMVNYTFNKRFISKIHKELL